MRVKDINWFALVGGILLLVVLAVSIYFPWWQIIIGQNLLTVNASPVNTNFGLMGTPFNIPLIFALNLGALLTFLACGIILIIYSILPSKPYSKDLLNFSYRKPLYAVIIFVIAMIGINVIANSALGINIPIQGKSNIEIPSSFMFGLNVTVSVLITTSLMWPFWLGIVAAILCIGARLYHPKLNPKAPASPIASQTPPLTPAPMIS